MPSSTLRRTTHTVRLVGTSTDRMITPRLADLRVRNESPGGFTSVTMSLAEPITSEEIQHFDMVYVYDARTAEVVGAGRLEDPGKAADDQGEIWSLTAIGMGPAHMDDVERGYIAIDTHLDGFRRVFRSNGPGAVAEITDDEDGEGGLHFQFPGGMDIVAGTTAAAMQYDSLFATGQEMGAYRLNWDAGFTGSSEIQAGTNTDPELDAASLDTAGGSFVTYKGGPGNPIPDGDSKFRIRLRRPTGTTSITVANDTHWAKVTDIAVHAVLHEKDGTELVFGSQAYNDRWVLVSEIVEDLLGLGDRLPLFDGTHATVETTTQHVDQFAYPDPIKTADLFADLLQLEGAYTWHVWAPSKYDPDLWEFEFVAKPTTVKYEASVIDGFSRPSSASEVYDKVQVRWKDSKRRTRLTTRTATEGLLVRQGKSRTAALDLSEEMGSVDNAERAGDIFLEDHAEPPNIGSLRIARRILDVETGRLVGPSHIRAGELIRVRGVEAYPDSLNADTNDGVTVFRIVSSEYTDQEGAAELELDAYSPDEARLIAQTARRRLRKG